jgi:RHS repeat-associated protein
VAAHSTVNLLGGSMANRVGGSGRTLGATAAVWLLCFAFAPEASAQVPPAPTLVSPASGGTVYSATPTYTWNEALGATNYTLNVRDASNTILTISYSAASVCSGSTCSVTPANTLSNTTYYWKVRGTNGSGNGPWSAEASFSAVPPNWNQGLACTGVFLTGDFNGDGSTDRLCSQSGTTNVSLATPTGFAPAAAWLGSVLLRPVVADFNGDGKDDVAEFKPATGIFQVATSTGSAFTTLANWGTATATFNGATRNCKVDPIGTGSGDFDGDGRPDVWCKRNTDGYIFVGRSTGTSFTFSVFADFTCVNGSQTVGAADIDGDGKSDWYSIAQNDTLCARLSDGASFTIDPIISLPSTYCAQDKYVLADLNGDGREDVHCPTNGNVALSTGLSFLDQGNFGAWCNVGGTQVMAGNLDGDGPTELVCNNANAPTGDIEVRKWTGSSLDSAQVWLESWCSGQAGTGDFDGDGKTDLLCDQVTVATGGKAGIMPDLMVQTATGLGGVTLVEYTPSTVFQHVNNPGVKHVVTAQTQQDGRGGSSTWNYTYSGGKFDRQEKQFLGYAYARTDAPCISGEAVCPYGEFSFSQDLASPGVLTTSMQRDGAGQLLRRVQYTYANTSTLPRTSLLTRTDVWEYDSGGGSKQTFSTYQYDGYGNRTQQVSAGGTAADDLQIDWMYSPNTGAYIVGGVGRIEQRAPGGSVLAAQEYLYDGAGTWSVPPQKGDLTKLRRFLDTTGQYVARTAGFDAYGNQTSSTDETNRTVTTTFDGTDHLFPVSVTNAAGETEGMVWDAACGVVTQSTDANGQTTSRQYDDLCRLTQTTGPLGAFEGRSYHDLGSPTLQHMRVESPSAAGVSGNDWVEDYFDGVGHTYRSRKRGPSSGQDIVVDRSYNARGALESISAPYYAGEPAYVTTYEYDALNRRTALEHPGGARVETSYAVSSLTQTDENGKPTTVQFDDSGHPVLEQRSLNGQTVETASTYDTLGRMVGMTDDVGNDWQWTIDSLGRITARSDPDAGNWSYGYDNAGRTLTQTDAKGQNTTMTYDAVGRIASKTSGVGATSYTWSQPRAGFYNVGRLTSVGSPGTTLQLDYDGAGRSVRQARTLDSVNYVLERRYDAAGRVTGITYPDGDAVGTPGNPWGYDDAGRLASIPGILSSIDYDAAGRPTGQTNANGTQTDRVYAAERGFLEQVVTSGSLQDLTYINDPAGLVTQVTSAHANEAWSYGYDALYRLTSATSLNNPSENQLFEYDTIGRITYNSKVGNYSYPSPGQPRPHAPTAINGNSYNYDANGNLASGGGQSFVWDAENRLSQVGSAQFAYDADGERLKKTAPGVTSLYPLGDAYEVTNGQVTKYVTVPGLGVVAKRVGNTTFWLHTDRLGSIQVVSDAAGAEVLRRTYRPYGETIADSTGHVESRGWIEQRHDEETSLTYLHARYYDPALGTFLSPDPLGPAGSLNSHGYASGNPITLKDPTGLLVECSYDGCTGITDGTTVTAAMPTWDPSVFPATNYNAGPGTSMGSGPGGPGSNTPSPQQNDPTKSTDPKPEDPKEKKPREEKKEEEKKKKEEEEKAPCKNGGFTAAISASGYASALGILGAGGGVALFGHAPWGGGSGDAGVAFTGGVAHSIPWPPMASGSIALRIGTRHPVGWSRTWSVSIFALSLSYSPGDGASIGAGPSWPPIWGYRSTDSTSTIGTRGANAECAPN